MLVHPSDMEKFGWVEGGIVQLDSDNLNNPKKLFHNVASFMQYTVDPSFAKSYNKNSEKEDDAVEYPFQFYFYLITIDISFIYASCNELCSCVSF